MKIRTCVTFKSDAFNTSTPKPEFVHPQNYGDDVVRWFMGKLRDRQIFVDEEDPSQEDHGWYATFRLDGLLYDVVVSYAPDGAAQRWLMAIERSVGLLGSLIGQRRRGVTVDVVRLVHEILAEADECRDIKWLLFDDVREGKLDDGTAAPVVV